MRSFKESCHLCHRLHDIGSLCTKNGSSYERFKKLGALSLGLSRHQTEGQENVPSPAVSVCFEYTHSELSRVAG